MHSVGHVTNSILCGARLGRKYGATISGDAVPRTSHRFPEGDVAAYGALEPEMLKGMGNRAPNRGIPRRGWADLSSKTNHSLSVTNFHASSSLIPPYLTDLAAS